MARLAVANHMRHKAFDAVDKTQQVNICNPLPVLKRDLPRPPRKADASVIDNEMHFGETGKSGIARGHHAVYAGGIDEGCADVYIILSGDLFCGAFIGLAVNIGEHKMRAFGGKGFGNREANA